MNILIAEDNEDSRLILRKTLESVGHEVQDASNGAEALEIAKGLLPDMIISDILMPGMDGFKLCRMVKQDKELRKIPFVFYTATYTDPKDERLAMTLGASRFIQKPFEADAFIRTINEVIDEYSGPKLQVPEMQLTDDELSLMHEDRLARKLDKKVRDLEHEHKALLDKKAALNKSEEDVKRYAQRLKHLHMIDRKILAASTIEEIARVAVSDIHLIMPCNRASVVKFDIKTRQATILAVYSECRTSLESREHVPIEAFGVPEELLQGNINIVEDITLQPDVSDVDQQLLSEGVKSYMNVPIIFRDNLTGSFNFGFSTPGAFKSEDIEIARDIANQLSIAFHQLMYQEALRDSEEQFKSIFKNARDGILIADVRTKKFLIGNQVICQMLGYGPEEIKRLNVTDIHPQKALPFVIEQFEKQAKKELSIAEGLPVQRKDRSVFYADISSSPIKLGGEDYLIGIFRDITKRREADEALRLSEEKFSKAFRSSPTLVSISTLKEGRFLEVNDAFLETTGYNREEVVGHTSRELGLWPDASARDQAMSLLIKQDIINNMEVSIRIKTGGVLSLLWSAERIYIEGEMCALAVASDITERKRLEAQLLQAQKMESVGQLAGGIAHDFNNILTAIISYAHLMTGRIKEDDPINDNISKIISLSDKASKITQALLAFSRKQHFKLVPVRLNEIIRGIYKLLLKFIGEDIEIKTDLTGKDPVIRADKIHIEQVIINLATNARDAMPTGGTLTLKTDIAEIDASFINDNGFGRPGVYALLTLADTGTGIDEESQQKIFEPFFTTKDVGKGTGLGLSISYGIIKQHNGYIDMSSEPANGTIVKIYLPEVRTEVYDERERPVLDVKGHGETILIAEDEADVREPMRQILEESGYKVIEAVNGDDAVDRYSEHKEDIALLILDVIMPQKSGKQALKEIKQVRPDIKAIFTSGYTRDKVIIEDMEKENMAFLSKPIPPDRLLSKIREVLEG